MDTLRIWEADCGLFDAVLSFSFETEELLNCCQSAGLEQPSCPCHGRDGAVLGAVHRECHDDTPLARLMERRLNVVHKRALKRLESEGFEAFARRFQAPPYQLEDLAGSLWALTVCDHPGAPALRVRVRSRLAMTGLQLIARTNARYRELAAKAKELPAAEERAKQR